MRKIIVLQSLLILAGAYYIYTLQQSAASPATEIEVIEVSNQSNETAPAAATTDDTVEATTTTEVQSTSDITGPSDVGMEFPIPDDESAI